MFSNLKCFDGLIASQVGNNVKSIQFLEEFNVKNISGDRNINGPRQLFDNYIHDV